MRVLIPLKSTPPSNLSSGSVVRDTVQCCHQELDGYLSLRGPPQSILDNTRKMNFRRSGHKGKSVNLLKLGERAGGMARQFRMLPVLSEDPSSVPGTHTE